MVFAAALGLVLAPGTVALALLLTPLANLGNLRRRVSASVVWLMLLGAALWSLPTLILGAPAPFSNLQATALVAIVLAVSSLALQRTAPRIAAGVLLGLSALALLSLLQIAGVGSLVLVALEALPGTARLNELGLTAAVSGRASGWMEHPNLWATRGLVPGLFVLTLTSAPRWRLAVAVPATLIALASGSRAAVVGLAVGLLLLGLHHLATRPFGRREGLALLLTLTAAFILLLLPPWRSRMIALVDILDPAPATAVQSRNLFVSSADLGDLRWFGRGVTVEPLDGAEGWRIEKTLPGNAQRLQQQLDLAPGTYTLSVELLPDPGTRPGLLSFWRGGEDVVHSLAARRIGNDWRSNVRGDLTVLSLATTPLTGGWVRLDLSFRQAGTDTITFPIGFTPDQREEAGAGVGVRRPQLVVGGQPLPYQPTLPPDRDRLQAQASAQGRERIFAAAWQGFLRHPLLGHGDIAFVEWFRLWSGNDGVSVVHAHNLVLQTLFARGVVGMLGLGLLLLAMVMATRANTGFLVLLAAVLAANLFDVTFWSAGQSYLLAVAAGWAAGTSNRDAAHPAITPG